MSRISKGKEILDSLPRIESDPKEDLMKLKRIHEVMRKHKEKAKTKMTKEQAKSELIEVLMNQVEQLSMMSKIELGDDVIAEIARLKEIINE
jgi:CxxC motif-containing protein